MSHATISSLPVTVTTNGSSPLKADANKNGDFIYIKHEDGQHVLLPTALAQQLTQYTPGGILPSSTLMKKARKRAPNWSNEEQACLVRIWSAPEMQDKFKKATRKWPLWEEMGKLLERAGFYGRDAKQCEALMHRLKSTYYRCVNHNRQPGNEPQYCAFYNEIDAVLSQKDACKSYVESDEESRVSDGELQMDAGSDEEKQQQQQQTVQSVISTCTPLSAGNAVSLATSHPISTNSITTPVNLSNGIHDNLKHFVEQLAESQLQFNLKSSYSNLLGGDNPKLNGVDYTSLIKLLRSDVANSTGVCSKTSPKMADSTTMSPPMSVPRLSTPQSNKRPRPVSPAVSLSTEEYLHTILAQSPLSVSSITNSTNNSNITTNSSTTTKLSTYNTALQELKLLNRATAAVPVPTGGPPTVPSNLPSSVTAADLERACANITDRLLDYLQARDQVFLSLSEKRIKLEEERERRRVEREAEIELKRHQLIVKVCELITTKCSTVTSPSTPALPTSPLSPKAASEPKAQQLTPSQSPITKSCTEDS